VEKPNYRPDNNVGFWLKRWERLVINEI